MRRNLQHILFACMIAFGGTATAQISEGFEPSGNGSLSVRDELIMNNWLLPDFDVNPEGSTPISGSMSMGSGPSYKADQNSGIVTPYLSFGASETVSFNYTLHRAFSSDCRRWFLVYVGNEANQAFLVDSVEVPSSQSVMSYSKQITGFTGNYVVYINVKGDGCNSKFIIDNLSCSATNANLGHPAGLIINGNPVGGGNVSENYHPVNQLNPSEIQTPSLNTSSVGDGQGFFQPSNPDNGSVGGEISLYPNPVNNNVNLRFSSNTNQEGQIEIFNVSGAKLMSLPTTINEGDNTVSIDVANLTAGNYFVSLVTNEGTTNKRFTRIQ